MRELLTGFAIILIVILTTILVAPYFVDWNGQRAFLEARLGRALGQPITIGGNIDLKLLPTPYLILDQVVVGDDEAPVHIGIHHLNLELAATPLLHGEFDITEARLEEPRVRITLQPDRSLPALPKAPAFSADVRFDRIHVANGSLSVADPTSGRTFLFDHLDLDADAGSFAGPFKVNGREGREGARTSFRLSTASPEKGRTRVHFTIDETPTHAAYDFDGNADFKTSADKGIQGNFEGAIVLAGHLREGNEVSIPWRLSGPLSASQMQATLDGGELKLGGEDASVTLQANAKGDFESPNMALDLSAKQLDFDRLSGAPVDPKKPPPPPPLPDLTTLRHLLADLKPPVRTALDLSIENALYGGETLNDLQAHLGLGEATQPLRVSAEGPGGARVTLDGHLTTDQAPSFTGHAEFAADNLPRTADWLASVAPSFPWKAADLRFKHAKLDGHFKAANDKIDSDYIALTLDRTAAKGSLHVAFGDDAHASRLAADLKADPLDIDGLPTASTLLARGSPFDLDLKLDAKSMKVARVGDAPLETGSIRLAVSKTGRRIELKQLQAEDLGGARIDVKASLDPQIATLVLNLDAGRLDRFAALVQQVAPGDLADKLAARAPLLAPAKIKIDAALNGPLDGALVPSRITVAGMLGATKIEASAKPTGNQTRATSVAATADAPEGSALLAQVGFKTLPGVKVGQSRVSLSARGRRGDRIETTLNADLGETKMAVTGGFDLRSTNATGAGTLHLDSPDVTPLLQSLAVAFPDIAGRKPVDINGSIALQPDHVSLNNLKGEVDGSAVDGSLSWNRDAGDKPKLTGSLGFDRARLGSLVELALGMAPASDPGSSWSTQPFSGGLIEPPRTAVAVKAKTFEIVPGTTATNAGLDLDIASGLVTLNHVKAQLDGGKATGSIKMRRDGQQATIEGKLALDGVSTDLAPLSANLMGQMDFAGSGTSPKGLIASLAGSGEMKAANLTIKDADPAALPRIFDDIENDVLAVDEESVVRAFEDGGKAPLSAGTRRFGISLVGGVLHFNPKDPALPEKGPIASKVEAAFDLPQWKLDASVGETLLKLPKDWNGGPPTVVVKLDGSPKKTVRSFDISAFLNALAARALAREAARVEAYEFDIRERAFFNARLQTERRREQERLLAEEQAQKAEAERKAAEAAEQERLQKEQKEKDDAAKAEADKANQEKGSQDDKNSPDKGGQDQGNASRDGGSARAPDANSESDTQSRAGRRTTERRSPNEPPRPPRRPAPAITDPSTFGRY